MNIHSYGLPTETMQLGSSASGGSIVKLQCDTPALYCLDLETTYVTVVSLSHSVNSAGSPSVNGQ